MGWLKRAVKKVVKAIKTVVRHVVRVVATVWGLVAGVFDLIFGFAAWPKKKLRLQIYILSKKDAGPLVDAASLTPAIDFAEQAFKKRFNVELRSFKEGGMIGIIEEPAPSSALNVGCDLKAYVEEFKEAGDFFASHLVGWNAVPVSGKFPITVFIVENVSGKQGCSLGPLTDYITVDLDGVANPSLMAHEIGHACNLWHWFPKSNLMYKESDRGDEVSWFQKNLFRSSRHVTYW